MLYFYILYHYQILGYVSVAVIFKYFYLLLNCKGGFTLRKQPNRLIYCSNHLGAESVVAWRSVWKEAVGTTKIINQFINEKSSKL